MARRPGAGLRPKKLHTEQMCLFFAEDYGLPVRMGRHQSIYGPQGWYDGRPGESADGDLPEGRQGEADAASIRSRCGATARRPATSCTSSDAVDAITGDHGQRLRPAVNLGTGTTTTVAELVAIIADIAGWKVRAPSGAGAAGRAGQARGHTRVAAHVAWKSQVSVREGMERTYADVYDRVKAELG